MPRPRSPKQLGYRRPTGTFFRITDAMIGRRNALANRLGYVLRSCSMGNGVLCWESEALVCEWRGKQISASHCHPKFSHNGDIVYCWPREVELMAWGIDRGRPLPEDS